MPPSLVQAVRTFIVARAIRLARGHEFPHCSMLVNASRFTGVQGQIRSELHNLLLGIRARVSVNGALPMERALADVEINALYEVWQDEYQTVADAWPSIQKRLHEAAAPIKVVEVNSRSSGSLNYADSEKTGLNVIAVGGYSLSRGLTLEGLMVSYFLRNSMMYDTLMQMARWFGYRPDYEDLCRVWMPEEAEGWYSHISESIEILRDELRSMEAAGATPEEFGLKVRSHPDSLIVTARNKMGSGAPVIWNVRLGRSFIETAILRRDEESLRANRAGAVRMVAQLAAAGALLTNASEVPGGWLLSEAPVAPILDFISGFRNHTGSMLTAPGPVRGYIEDRSDGELARWDILFASTRNGVLESSSLGIKINCQRRTSGTKSDSNTLYISNKQRIASRGVEKTGLTAEQIVSAEKEHREAKGRTEEQGKTLNYPDHIYRNKRERPLLIVHLLEVCSEDGERTHYEPVVAWSISFPRTELEEKRAQYVVNTVWFRENCREEVDEEREEDND